MTHFEGRALACFRGGRLVFQNLEFSLGPGDATLVTGPNGSGKSTLLRLLAGLLKAADGTLTFAGKPVSDDIEALISGICKEACDGDHVVVMSNGGFAGFHQRLLDSLGARHQ